MKKKELKQPDRVQQVLEQALEGAAGHLAPILIGFGVILLVALTWIGISHYREKKIERFNAYYGKALNLIEEGRSRPATDETRFQPAKELLEQLYEQAAGSPIYPHVLLALATVYQEQGMYKEAIGVLNELEQMPGLDPAVRDVVYYRLVKLYEADYNVSEAVRVARKALAEGAGPFALLVKKDMERMGSGSLNPGLTDQLKQEELRRSDLAPKQKKPIAIPLH